MATDGWKVAAYKCQACKQEVYRFWVRNTDGLGVRRLYCATCNGRNWFEEETSDGNKQEQKGDSKWCAAHLSI